MERKAFALRLFNLLGIVLLAAMAKAQITSEMKVDMASLATREIAQLLENGMEEQDWNHGERSHKSLKHLVQSGQILDFLGTSPKNKEHDICEWLASSSFEPDSAETIFLRAEAHLLFQCSGSVSDRVMKDVQRVLSNPVPFMSSPSNLYATSMIYKRKKAYGCSSEGAEFKEKFVSVIFSGWLPGFNPETFAFGDGPVGATADALKFLEVLIDVSAELGEASASKVKKAVQTLLAQASATSSNDESENQIFFIAPRGAMNPQEFDLSEVNFHFQNVLIATGHKSVDLSNMRNYFMARAIAHSNVQSLYYALGGLRSSNAAFFLEAVDGFSNVHATEAGKNILKFEVVDFLGKPMPGNSLLKASILPAGFTEQGDVTPAARVVGSKVIITLDNLGLLPWSSHTMIVDLKIGKATVNFRKVFAVKVDILPEAEVAFAQTSDWNAPSSYDVTSFPQKLKPLSTNSFPIVHILANTQLVGDKNKDQDYPQAVYVTLEKKGILSYSVHANYIASIKRHQISFDLRVLMPDQINGEYALALHIEDPRAEKPFVVDMGILQIKFNEGSQEATNSGIRSNFQLLEKITNYFPPEEESEGGVLPLAFCGFLVVLFVNYLGSFSFNKANLSKLQFKGILFVVNYLLVLGVIVAFWIEINLVKTLWILLAMSPMTLWTMNSGLTPENCQVPPFKQAAKVSVEKKKK